jgi:hypothetical protein
MSAPLVDYGQALRRFLLADAGLAALVGERIYANSDVPEAGYTPGVGGAICFTLRGGRPEYVDVLLRASVQFRCYAATEVEADALYRALYAALHNAQSAAVRWARCEVLGQPLVEPETGWPMVLSVFTVWLANG